MTWDRKRIALVCSPADLERNRQLRRLGELEVRPWTGGEDWAEEIVRLAMIMQCRETHHSRFVRTCGQLTAWRLRSPAQCNQGAIEAILPLLEGMKHAGCSGIDVGPFGPHRTGWTRRQFGELLCIARNRAKLYSLGRARPKPKGPALDPQRLPDDRLAFLIQRHQDMDLVERLRDERRRRQLQGESL